MTPQDPNLDPLLEQAIAEIRDEPIDPAVIEAAASRVEARLAQHTTLESCADFQALIPAYRAGTLPAARALLLKDHTHECVACYRALQSKPSAPAPLVLRAARPAVFRWAMAAALVAAAGLGFWAFGDRLLPRPSGPEAMVESADGLIYRVSDTGTVPLIRGAGVPAGVAIRTARDTNAVLRLRDGSHVEMRERSGFSVSESGKDLTIALDHGAIIVQAAKRHSGHLYVATRDCRVAVTGTVFSVNSGIKGSRVTVIEGTVLVAQDRHERVLHAGDQTATSPAMGAMPVSKEISWSQNAGAYIAMLNAVTALNAKLDSDHFPALRFSSDLLALVPAQTVVYASIPNLSQALTEVQQVFVPKINQNPTLSQWWQQNKLDQVIADMSAMSGYLGNEMVVAASPTAGGGHPGQPVILAELTKPGFQAFAEAEVAKLPTSQNGHKMRIVTDPSAIGTIPQGECVLLILPHLVALSPDASALQQIAAGAPSTFATTQFGSQIAASYGAGVGLLFAADVESMAPAGHAHVPNLQYFMVQQTGSSGAAETRAAIIFKGQRTGVASWLAAPASLGALDFISPQATLAWAAAVKQPTAIIDEIMTMQQSNPAFQQHLAEVQALLGVDIRNDLAAALGSEVAMAQDGPVLPLPSWKVAVEVYDPVKLQSTIEKLVAAAKTVQLQQSTANGRTYYSIASQSAAQFPLIHYTYTDGYLLASSSQALIDSAIQNRASGYTLPRSATFTALIPHDQYANFSAMVYYNVGDTLSPLLEQFNQQQFAQELAANLKPTLIAAYGENDRITFATSGSLFTTIGNMSLLQFLEKPGTQVH